MTPRANGPAARVPLRPLLGDYPSTHALRQGALTSPVAPAFLHESFAEGLTLMTGPSFPRFGDVGHLGHIELFRRRPHESLVFFTSVLYCYEPGGNRFEIGAGRYLILDPDWKPVIWTQAERAKGQAWGMQTVSTFHTHGTPPMPVPGPTPAAPSAAR